MANQPGNTSSVATKVMVGTGLVLGGLLAVFGGGSAKKKPAAKPLGKGCGVCGR